MKQWLIIMLLFVGQLHACCRGRRDSLGLVDKRAVVPAILQNPEFRKNFKQIKEDSSTWGKIKKRWSPKHQQDN